MHINYSQTNLSTSSYSTQRLLQIATQGNRDALQKHLTNNPFDDSQLNQALFCCINNSSTLSHHEECLIILLRYKADPNCIINDRTPLMSASSSGHQIIVRRLLEYGAKVDGRDSQGNYPLFYALNKNTQNFDVIQLLIDRMTNLNIEIAKKITPIGFAIRKQFDKTVKKLIQRNITPYINEENGDTLLHLVCKQPFRSASKQQKIIKLLLTKIGLYIKNKEGKAAFEYLHNEEIKQMILDLAKPKVNQTKVKKVKKQAQEEEIDLSGDELQEENSPLSKLNKIVEESDEEKRTEEKKEKTILKSKKLVNSATIPTSTKPKDLMKSITKSTSNQKFKQIKEVREVKEKQKVPVKYERKKSTKSILSKSTGNKDSNKEKEGVSRELQTIKQVTNEEINNRSSIKQREKQQELKLQMAKEAAQEKQQALKKEKKLREQIEELESEISMIESRIKPSDHYMLGASKNCQLSPFEVSPILTSQIKDFVSEQEKICAEYSETNQLIFNLIASLLTNRFKQIETRLEVYGSQASGLCLSTSDIDLVIDSDMEPFQYLQLIENSQVFNVPDIKQVKFIKTTSVPIIKLQTAPSLQKRRVDITFQTKYHNGIKCNNLIEQYLSKMHQLKPLVLVIKQILYINQLHDTYTGGLGSYSVLLMVVAFLQSTNIDKSSEDSLGLLLLYFFKYYGYEMDYIKKSILIYSPQYQSIPYGNNVFELTSSIDLSCKLVLHDPLNPNNNVSRSTYKIKAIKQLFMLAYTKLLFNKRCTLNCKGKLRMSEEEEYWIPCCLLKRLFTPQILMQLE